MAKLEHILALTEESVNAMTNQSAFRYFSEDFNLAVIEPSNVVMMCREVLENDPRYMQVIPYVMFEQGGKFLVYRRTTRGNEERLHNRYSIGIGGHVDGTDICYKPDDNSISLVHSVARAALREAIEEVGFVPDKSGIKEDLFMGLINDRSDEVGRVHVGVATVISFVNDIEVNFRSKEDQLEIVGFQTLDEILATENLENWSKIVAEQFREITWE